MAVISRWDPVDNAGRNEFWIRLEPHHERIRCLYREVGRRRLPDCLVSKSGHLLGREAFHPGNSFGAGGFGQAVGATAGQGG